MRTENPLYPIVQYIESLESNVDGLSIMKEDLYLQVQQLKNQMSTMVIPKSDWEIKVDNIILAGQYASQLKIPYKFSGEYENDKAFDCSSFTQSIFKSQGIVLPRTSVSQSTKGTEVAYQDIRKGDLLFFDTNSDKVINHVGVYVGNGSMLHTNTPSKPIRIEGLEGYWKDHFITARRVL